MVIVQDRNVFQWFHCKSESIGSFLGYLWNLSHVNELDRMIEKKCEKVCAVKACF
ncbi:hypothetical protein JCM19047_3670 [Bacillus sp. JCM 19047]|nr:hypothetical protein JCM19047_3670 [Bacillus sp. JCM 19047]